MVSGQPSSSLRCSFALWVCLGVGLGSHDALGQQLPGWEHRAIRADYYIGSGEGPAMDCTVVSLDHPNAIGTVYHEYGAGGGGASWSYAGLVLSPGPRHTGHQVLHPAPEGAEHVVLRLGLSSTDPVFVEQDSSVLVAGIAEVPPMIFHRETHTDTDCPPSFCLVPKPQMPSVSGVEQLASPKCGWAPKASASVTATSPPVGSQTLIEIDVTPLVAANFTAFRVSVVPTVVSKQGMWQTPHFTLTSMGFYNLRHKKESEGELHIF